MSFYSVTFHSSFHHFYWYTTGFCPWSSSLPQKSSHCAWYPIRNGSKIFFLCCTYHLEYFSSTYSFLWFIICFPRFTQNLISKVSSTIVINSLHNVSSDFDPCTSNGHSSLPCISHIASFLQNNLIAWKGRSWRWNWHKIIIIINDLGTWQWFQGEWVVTDSPRKFVFGFDWMITIEKDGWS